MKPCALVPIMLVGLAACHVHVREPRSQVEVEVYDLGPPPGESVWSVEIFYDELDPYGTWVEYPGYGYVFDPYDDSYEPYTNGSWSYTEYGFTWISEDEFGWACDHYGRWFWDDGWYWWPDTDWGPAWVDWVEGDDLVAWVPTPPDGGTWTPPARAWRFVRWELLVGPGAQNHYDRFDDRARVEDFLRGGRRIARRGRHGLGRDWAIGPSPDRVRRHGIDLVAQPLPERRVGRLDRESRRDFQERLDERVRRRAERIRDDEDRRRRDEADREARRRAAEAEEERRRRAEDEQRERTRKAEETREAERAHKAEKAEEDRRRKEAIAERDRDARKPR